MIKLNQVTTTTTQPVAPETHETLNTAQVIPRGLTSIDLEQLQILKTKLKNISSNLEEGDFISQVEEVLAFLDIEDILSSKKEIVLYVMFKLERFVLKRGAGQTKKALAIRLLSPIFHDDLQLTDTVVELCMGHHHQIKMWGRLSLKLYRFFSKK
jgi:hypothetical protein